MAMGTLIYQLCIFSFGVYVGFIFGKNSRDEK